MGFKHQELLMLPRQATQSQLLSQQLIFNSKVVRKKPLDSFT